MPVIDSDEYCREVEAYLCRKNDGHLIRLVGPAFEQVSGWQARGIPLQVVFQGIERSFSRYYARGPRRRPLQIAFCESDVLDAFDAWRRAVGVRSGVAGTGEGVALAGRRRSLPVHVGRVIARLTALRAEPGASSDIDRALEQVVRELDAARAGLPRLRGDARTRFLDRLAELDRSLLASFRAALPPVLLTALAREAENELEPFRDRMPPPAFRRAVEARTDALLADRVGLPHLAYESTGGDAD
jgi:hypothetical protein